MRYFISVNTTLLLTLFSFFFSANASEDIESLLQPCAMCHGNDGNSQSADIPSIAGITKEYFIHTIDAYKNDGRDSDVMKSFVLSLSKKDIERLAGYYMKQSYQANQQAFDPEMAMQGEKLHNKFCEKCHENGGKSTENNYGILAGQGMEYLRVSIQGYLDGRRRVNPMMITKLKALEKIAGKDGIEKIIHFYASVK